MPLNISWSRVAVLAAALLLPLKAGGCAGQTACFTFTQDAYAKNMNACPAAEPTALNRLSSSACGSFGPFSSVDGPGSFNGEFCCYPVTPASNWFDCGNSGGVIDETGTGGGVGGAGGAGGAGGFEGSSTHVAVAAATGTGGAANCFACSQELDGTSTDPGQLCPTAATFWATLNTCLCGNGPCTMACSDNGCTGQMSSPACQACSADTSSAGCGSQLADCEAN